MYVCVCVCMYMCVCVCIYIYVCMCVCVYIRVCVCMWKVKNSFFDSVVLCIECVRNEFWNLIY